MQYKKVKAILKDTNNVEVVRKSLNFDEYDDPLAIQFEQKKNKFCFHSDLVNEIFHDKSIEDLEVVIRSAVQRAPTNTTFESKEKVRKDLIPRKNVSN